MADPFPLALQWGLRQEEGEEPGEESDTFVSPQGPQDAVWKVPTLRGGCWLTDVWRLILKMPLRKVLKT